MSICQKHDTAFDPFSTGWQVRSNPFHYDLVAVPPIHLPHPFPNVVRHENHRREEGWRIETILKHA